jgi:parallel beta-helix repeat protein
VRDQSRDITIEQNVIFHCFSAIYTWRPKPAMTNSIIRKNHTYQNFNTAIDVREDSSNNIVEENVIEYSGITHISFMGGVTNSTIRSNIAQYGGYYSETMTFPGSSAISMHTSRVGNIVEGNLASYQIDLTGVDGNGFIADIMEGHRVIFRNNIAYRNMGAGINFTRSPNCIIANNSLIENGYQQIISPDHGAGIKLSRGQDTGQTIVNNIFYNNRVSGISAYRLIADQKKIDNNFYSVQNGSALIKDGSNSIYSSLTEVRKNTSWEQHGQQGEPDFVDTKNRNFHLKASSPAIDSGVMLSEVTDDYNRNPRPRGKKHDIGAFEFHAPRGYPSAPTDLRLLLQ